MAAFNGNGATTRRWRRVYFLLTFAIAGLGLLPFVTLSVITGLMTFGAATTWRYPGDYLAAGLA